MCCVGEGDKGAPDKERSHPRPESSFEGPQCHRTAHIDTVTFKDKDGTGPLHPPICGPHGAMYYNMIIIMVR